MAPRGKGGNAEGKKKRKADEESSSSSAASESEASSSPEQAGSRSRSRSTNRARKNQPPKAKQQQQPVLTVRPQLATKTAAVVAPANQNSEISPRRSKLGHKDEASANPKSGGGCTFTRRLVIQNIMVDNFKSYAGRHMIGPFHSTFTAIIGPNGSGKSNVIDSLLFVFGKNAKKLRLDKLAELIHNSAAYPDLTHCSVTVNFVEQIKIELKEGEPVPADPAALWQDIPETELSIMREVHRSGVSQYYINDAKSTQKEVIQLLTDKGVDLEHNRFLILQGEVEQIAMMKPKAEKEGEEGLLEYFDDLIGTNSFVAQLNGLKDNLEALQDQRLALLDVKKRTEDQLNALAAAKESTLAFVSKDNHLQHLVSILCQLKNHEIQLQLREPQQKLDALKEELRAADKEAAELREQTKAKEKEQNGVKLQAQALNQELTAKLEEKQKIEEKMVAIKEGNSDAENRRKKQNEKVKKLMEDIRRLETSVAEAERDSKLTETFLNDATAAVEKLEPQFERQTDELESVMKPLRKKKENLEREAAPAVARLTAATEAVKDSKEALANFLSAHERQREELREHMDSKVSREAERVKKLKVIAEAESVAAEGSIDDKLRVVDEALRNAAKKKVLVNARINEVKAMYTADQDEDRIAKFLNSKKELKGYFGQLRQLGRIADEYDLAAGVASNAWNFHIVDTTQTAQECVRLLREGQIGRASFYSLDQGRKSFEAAMDSKFKCPPEASRLFDLIKPTEGRFAVAFYFAVRDTLVVKDTETARRLGLEGDANGRKHRVVTIDGAVVDPKGSVTGGGSKDQLKPAKLKAAASPADQQRVKEILLALQEQLKEAVMEEHACQQQQSELYAQAQTRSRTFDPAQIRRMRSEVAQLEAALEYAQGRIAKLEKDIAAFEQSPQSQAKHRQLSNAVAEAERELMDAQAARDQFTRALDQLKHEMDHAGGEAYTTLKTQLETQQKKKEELTKKLNDLKKQYQKDSSTLTRTQERLVQAQEELAKITAEQANSNKEELQRLDRALLDFDYQIGSKRTELKRLQDAVNDFSKKIDEIAEKMRLNTRQLEDFDRQAKELEEEMREKKQRMDKFNAKIMELDNKVRTNIREFGVETLQREDHHHRAAEEEEDDQEDDADEDEESDDSTAPARNRRRLSDGARKDGNRKAGKNATHSTQDHKRSATSKSQNPNSDRKTNESMTEEELESYTTVVPVERLQLYEEKHCHFLASELNKELEVLRSKIDLQAIHLWKTKDKEFQEVRTQYEAVVEAFHEGEARLEMVKEERKTLFMEKFRVINEKLKHMYQMITDGGDAEVELVDAQDPFEGINFVVRPPKKSWKQVGNLSGGEKTLSSLALVFALHHVKPTPIYVMDEIDAALDFRNVSIVARYILEQAVGAQFVIISLRNNMFELAHRLVGISKVRDCTQSVALDPRAAALKIERRVSKLQGGLCAVNLNTEGLGMKRGRDPGATPTPATATAAGGVQLPRASQLADGRPSNRPRLS